MPRIMVYLPSDVWNALAARAIRQRRPAPMQIEVELRRALRVPVQLPEPKERFEYTVATPTADTVAVEQ